MKPSMAFFAGFVLAAVVSLFVLFQSGSVSTAKVSHLEPSADTPSDNFVAGEAGVSGSSDAGEGEIKIDPVLDDQPEADECNYSALVGQKESEIDRSIFKGKTVRILKPGAMVTMEYMFGRVNLQVDDSGTIVAVTCG